MALLIVSNFGCHYPLAQLEHEVWALVRRSPQAVIDERILAQKLSITEAVVRRFLVELVSDHQLETIFLWVCPESRRTISEERRLSDFPDRLECSHCGREHTFSQDDVEVRCIASEQLKRDVAASSACTRSSPVLPVADITPRREGYVGLDRRAARMLVDGMDRMVQFWVRTSIPLAMAYWNARRFLDAYANGNSL